MTDGLSDGRKQALVFGGAIAAAGIVMATVVFPFWNLIREDVFEEVEILRNDGGTCYAETSDSIPKTIRGCGGLEPGDTAAIKYGRGLAWAEIVP